MAGWHPAEAAFANKRLQTVFTLTTERQKKNYYGLDLKLIMTCWEPINELKFIRTITHECIDGILSQLQGHKSLE